LISSQGGLQFLQGKNLKNINSATIASHMQELEQEIETCETICNAVSKFPNIGSKILVGINLLSWRRRIKICINYLAQWGAFPQSQYSQGNLGQELWNIHWKNFLPASDRAQSWGCQIKAVKSAWRTFAPCQSIQIPKSCVSHRGKIFTKSKILVPNLFANFQLDTNLLPTMPTDMTSNAPVVVAYLHQGIVKSVYLLAEGQIILSEQNLREAVDVITVILGCFYLFNREYPTVSKGLFDCLETFVLGKKVSKCSTPFIAFRRAYTNKKSAPFVKKMPNK
jgi:hypothetical protein